MPPTSSPNNNSNNEALVAIQVTLATHGEMLKNVGSVTDDIKRKVEKQDEKLDRYMPLQEANTRFENLQASITSILARLTEIELWRLQFLVNNVKDIATVQRESKQDVSQVKETSWARVVGVQGTVLLVAIGFIVWVIEQFLVNSHIFGG